MNRKDLFAFKRISNEIKSVKNFYDSYRGELVFGREGGEPNPICFLFKQHLRTIIDRKNVPPPCNIDVKLAISPAITPIVLGS